MRTQFLEPQSLTDAQVKAWADLESRALEANAYQSPHFVLPALRHLSKDLACRVALVGGASPDASTTAALTYQTSWASALLPCPHLSVYECEHSYLSTPLVDAEHSRSTLSALLDGLSRRHRLAAGLLIPQIDAAGPVVRVFTELLAERGLSLMTQHPRERATLCPAQSSAETLKASLGKKFNEMERQRRRLSEQGEIQWRMIRQADETRMGQVIETFLRLEHAGWKGEAGTSLRANPGDEAFFREMSSAFARAGRAMFTEMTLAGEAIAATANYLSGRHGFAFKVGWDPAYRKFGPGILNEVELVRQASAVCADVAEIDSGSEPDSFIETLWPGRRTLVRAFVPFSRWGQQAWQQTTRMKHLVLARTRKSRPEELTAE